MLDHGGSVIEQEAFLGRADRQQAGDAEVLIAQGQVVSQVCKQIGVTDQTYYRWRKEYGGLKTDQAKRLRELERDNGSA